MDKQLKLRSGKFAGKTIAWLEENQNDYLLWVKENRPEMLVDNNKQETVKPKPMTSDSVSNKQIRPNLNFDNEGPDYISLKYLNNKND
jgi:hypothetical protein